MSLSSPTPSFFHSYAQLADPTKLSNESQRKASLLSEKALQRAKESKQIRRQAVLERQRARSDIVPFQDISQIPLPKDDDEIKEEQVKDILDFDNLPTIPQHFLLNEYQNIESQKVAIKTRTPSPIRRKSLSPVRRKSPSPVRSYAKSPIQRQKSPSPARSPVRSPIQRQRSPIQRQRSPSPTINEEEQIRTKIKQSVDRFQKCEEKGTEAQNVATKQTTMILLFLTGLFESANQMTGEKLLKIQDLSINVQAALKNNEFNKFISSIATHPSLVEFFQNPLSGFATTMAEIVMHTHRTNLSKINGTATRTQRRNNNQDEVKHCNCHECIKPQVIPITKPGTHVPWGFDDIPPEKLEQLTRMILAQQQVPQMPPQQFAPYGYFQPCYYPPQMQHPIQNQFQNGQQMNPVNQSIAQPIAPNAQPIAPIAQPITLIAQPITPIAQPITLINQEDSKIGITHRKTIVDPQLKTPRPKFQPDLPNVSFIGNEQFATMCNAMQNFQPLLSEMG